MVGKRERWWGRGRDGGEEGEMVGKRERWWGRGMGGEWGVRKMELNLLSKICLKEEVAPFLSVRGC